MLKLDLKHKIEIETQDHRKKKTGMQSRSENHLVRRRRRHEGKCIVTDLERLGHICCHAIRGAGGRRVIHKLHL
jgi:hypothetical protein